MSSSMPSNKILFLLCLFVLYLLSFILPPFLLLLLIPCSFLLFIFPPSFLSSSRSSIEKYDLTFSEDPASMDKHSQPIVNIFYNIVTDFYEYGWGDAFHFAARFKNESFKESIARHEYFLALKLNLTPKDKVLDMGCGVGGPMRRIAKFSGSEVTGVTLNEYQVKRCEEITSSDIKKIVKVRQGDFTNLDLPNESFDKIFSIEAHCHVNPRTKPYSEAYRLLKKGGYMATYDWVVTPKYDPSNLLHVKAKKGIEYGDALPDLITAEEIAKQAEEIGFEVVEHYDINLKAQERFGTDNVPWYKPLEPGFSMENWKSTWIGRQITTNLLKVLERCRIVPSGSVATAKMLEEGAMNLVEGGKLGIFTPMHFFLYRKN